MVTSVDEDKSLKILENMAVTHKNDIDSQESNKQNKSELTVLG